MKKNNLNSGKSIYRENESRYRKYGFSFNKYVEIQSNQKYKCFICEIMFMPFKLHIDHCHETGIARGLLCRNCNLGLGLFKDSKKLMGRAIYYLNKYPTIELLKNKKLTRKT